MVVINNLKDKVDRDEVDLSLLTLKDVPVEDIVSLRKVTKVDLSNNEIVSLPLNFASSLGHIVKLNLGTNKLTKLPSNFGSLRSLKHLDLYNNQLTDLPHSFADLEELRWIDVKGNPLRKEFAAAAGSCSDYKECTIAAKKLILICSRQRDIYDREIQMKLEKQREQEALEKKKESDERNKKNVAKKQAKKQKDQERKAVQKQNSTENLSSTAPTVQNGKSKSHIQEEVIKETVKEKKNKGKSGMSKLALVNIVLAVMLLCAGMLCFYVYSDGDLSVAGAQKAYVKLEQNGKYLMHNLQPVLQWTTIKAKVLFERASHIGCDIRAAISSGVNATSGFVDAKTMENAQNWFSKTGKGMFVMCSDAYSSVVNFFVEGQWRNVWIGVKMFGSFLYDQFLVVCEEVKRNDALNSVLHDYSSITDTLRSGALFVLEIFSNLWEILITKWLPEMQNQLTITVEWAKNSMSQIVS